MFTHDVNGRQGSFEGVRPFPSIIEDPTILMLQPQPRCQKLLVGGGECDENGAALHAQNMPSSKISLFPVFCLGHSDPFPCEGLWATANGSSRGLALKKMKTF